MARNLSALSTSAPRPSVRVKPEQVSGGALAIGDFASLAAMGILRQPMSTYLDRNELERLRLEAKHRARFIVLNRPNVWTTNIADIAIMRMFSLSVIQQTTSASRHGHYGRRLWSGATIKNLSWLWPRALLMSCSKEFISILAAKLYL